MVNRNKIMYLILGITILSACNNKEKETELNKREKDLLEKEDLFSKKEADYQSLLKMRDSIFAKKDSILIKKWPETIAGIWSAKSICSESSCSEYTIGDNRLESWDFKSDSLKLFTVNTHNKNSKIFDAKYHNNEIVLDYVTDSTAKRNMKINIVLTELGNSKMKGLATVTLDNQCNAKFNVELFRTSK